MLVTKKNSTGLLQIQVTSEFSDVYVTIRLISRTSTEFVNIYQISVYTLC